VERRTFTFIALSLAILLGAQALQAWLFPQPKQDLRPPAEVAAATTPASRPEGRDAATGDPADETPTPLPAVGSAAGPAASRTRFTLGSLDPAGPARMLVTLTSRGASVERIELADEASSARARRLIGRD